MLPELRQIFGDGVNQAADLVSGREAVRLTLTSGRSVERVANDLGIAKSTLSRWRSEHEQSDLLEGPHEDVGKELTRLRKENPSTGT